MGPFLYRIFWSWAGLIFDCPLAIHYWLCFQLLPMFILRYTLDTIRLVLPNEIRPTLAALHPCLEIKALRYLFYLLYPPLPGCESSCTLIGEASLMSHFRGDQLYSDRRCMLLPLKLYVWSHALLDGLIYVPLPRCLLLLFFNAHQILLEMRFIESGRR